MISKQHRVVSEIQCVFTGQALPAEPRGALTVEIFLDGISLSRILCHNEHASMDGALSTEKVFLHDAFCFDFPKADFTTFRCLAIFVLVCRVW